MKVSMKQVTVIVDEALWRTFRMSCIERDRTASEEIRNMIRARLLSWMHTQAADQEGAITAKTERA